MSEFTGPKRGIFQQHRSGELILYIAGKYPEMPGRKIIAMIDDDEDDLDFMEEAIVEYNRTFSCLRFMYPEKAMDALFSKEIPAPACIFIDINMPMMRGDECLQLIRGNPKFDKVPVVMYSTTMPESVAERLTGAGADYTFQKPTNVKQLTDFISNLFQRIPAR